MLVYAVFVVGVVYQHLAVAQVAPVPGIGWIGSTIHLLNGLDPFGSIIEHSYSGSKTSDGLFDISDVVIDVPQISCSYASIRFTADTYDEYQSESTSNLNVGGSFKLFTGAYSQTGKTVKKNIYKNKQLVTKISADCVQYSLSMIRRGVSLRSWFINDAKTLPDSIDSTDDLYDYFDFFDYYGTHIVTGCDVGGQLYQYSFTDESYSELYSKSEVTRQAEIKFFISVDASNAQTQSVTSTYEEMTQTYSIETVGGTWPNSLDNWLPWIQSIQSLENVACINWSARDITDVFEWSDELIDKQSVAEAALAQYFDVQGCTIPTALNYNEYALVDDSTCDYENLPEFRICFQEIEGSSQCQGTRSSCSDWSSSASFEDITTWTSTFRDDTDGRSGGCKYQWKLEQQDSAYTRQDHDSFKYRICFKETEGSSQCQGTRSTCSSWNSDATSAWTSTFRDDTDSRSGGCKYQWVIEQSEDEFAPEIEECRICFQETEGSSQCQGTRNTCTGWSKTSPAWTAYFRDDTDGRSGGCKYQWKIQCR